VEQNTTRSQCALHQIVKQNGHIKQQLLQDYERSKSQNVKLCSCALHSDSTQRKEQCPGRRSMINRGESLKHACSTKEKIKSTLEAHAWTTNAKNSKSSESLQDSWLLQEVWKELVFSRNVLKKVCQHTIFEQQSSKGKKDKRVLGFDNQLKQRWEKSQYFLQMFNR
jgi:hypothetical protein